MSGPKCDSYYVESGSNELLLQAQRAAAERAARLARERLEAALKSAQQARQKLSAMIATGQQAEKAFGASIDALSARLPVAPGAGSSVSDIERYIADTERVIAEITAGIGRAEGIAQLRALGANSKIAAEVADWGDELQQRKNAAEKKAASDAAPAGKNREELAAHIVSRLQGAANEAELKSIDAVVSEFVKASGAGRADALETELRIRVQRVNERIEKSKQDAVEAAKLLADLRGFKGRDVELIQEELQAVVDGRKALARGAVEKSKEVRANAEKRINDEYAGKVIREELERLGYAVGSEFSTLFVDGGEAVVSRPEESEYAVQMQVDAAKGLIDLAVVRISDSGNTSASERSLRDKSAEERWCADHGKLRTAIRARGVNGRLIKHAPPGAKPIAVTKSVVAAKPSRASRRPKKLMQRKIK